MSPIYTDEKTTREDLEKLSKTNKCKVCGGWLNLFKDYEKDFDTGVIFLACNDWLRTQHEGIEREASRYEMEGLAALNIPKRRQIMEETHGVEKTTALEKYIGVVSLTKPQAREILVAVYPEAPDVEIARAVMLCASYGLNPLMKHCFLIPFNKGKQNETWATVIGIKAKRLLASRRGSYSYTDNTPRVMTEVEQKAIFGEVYNDKIMVITKVKDPATGAEAPGYGAWPKDIQPYGTEKGNTRFNMAAIRSESQALDRLRPGEMPVGVEVVPEEAIDNNIEGECTVVEEEPKRGAILPPETAGTIREHWCQEHGCAYDLKRRGSSSWYAHKVSDGWCNEIKKKEATKAEVVEQDSKDLWSEDQAQESAPVAEAKGFVDMKWLEGALNELKAKNIKAGSESNLLGYMRITYKIEAETVLEGATLLGKNEAAHFARAIQDILDMA